MSIYQDPELSRLFDAYATVPGSISTNLTDALAERGRNDPLLAATATDLALFPGDGRPPVVDGIRLNTKGFKELASISHLGVALASLVNMQQLGANWIPDAKRLLIRTKAAHAVNNEELWRDRISVAAYAGREREIAEMVDYTCAVTEDYLQKALTHNDYLTAATLRDDYLEGGEVPVNYVMIATFFLVGMDIAHRFMAWFGWEGMDWERVMVVVAGKQGRATSGVTWNTNSVASMILGASGNRLPMDRMYIAPHAPVFPTPRDGDLSEVAAVEQPLRRLWYQTRATVELGETMFAPYPRFVPAELNAPDLEDGLTFVSDMPVVHSPQDMRSLITRFRVVLEDPRQLLSGAVTDYAVAQLVANGNDPAKVVVPGLTGVKYPTEVGR